MESRLSDLESNPVMVVVHGKNAQVAMNGAKDTLPAGTRDPDPLSSSSSCSEPPPAPASPPAPAERPGPRLRPRRRRNRLSLKRLIPAWGVSVLVHAAVLMTLAAATVSSQGSLRKVLNIDSALVVKDPGAEPELLHIYADPADIPRDRAIGDEHATAPGDSTRAEVGGDSSEGIATPTGGNPSKTPRFRGPGKAGQKASAEMGIGGGIPLVFNPSALSINPVAPALDLGGGGRIKGDPGQGVKEIGEALDQLAREILRHLRLHNKLTVVWLFDESTSMRDDQKAILEKFDRVSRELKLEAEPKPAPNAKKKSAPPLTHAIVGFGESLDPILAKPTPDVDLVGRAIKNLKIDPSGVENTMQAIKAVVDQYAGLITKDHKVLLVLVTDESGDDGASIEEARQVLMARKVPLYVIGRQSLFGFPFAHHRYEDKTTGDTYYPVIRRGPESADVEMYQWDGLYDRWDEQPSGFAPFELARLTRETGGIYFILPSEEFMRIRQREQAYSFAQLKEFMPEYDNRAVYMEKRRQSTLRSSLNAIVAQSRNFLYRREFPIDPQPLAQAADEEGGKATARLAALNEIQAQLEKLAKVADREKERRWKAHYDLMLASTVAFQVKAYEYRALMASILNAPPNPPKPRAPGNEILWVVDHSRTPQAPKGETAKKYAEAERLLKRVVATYPRTPWADLAQDALNRGLSVTLSEWQRSPKYAERMQFVPKY